jgi:hypothetical protein
MTSREIPQRRTPLIVLAIGVFADILAAVAYGLWSQSVADGNQFLVKAVASLAPVGFIATIVGSAMWARTVYSRRP